MRPVGQEPSFWVTNSHINYRDDGIYIDGAKSIFIKNNLFYNEDSAQQYAGVPHDVNLVNASGFIVSDNIFDFAGNPKRINVFVQSTATSAGDHGLIGPNIHRGACDYGVYLASLSNGVLVEEGIYPTEPTTERIHNSGTVNIVRRSKTVDKVTWTPALSFGGASTGITYSGTPVGSAWIADGSLVGYVNMTLTSKGTATGVAAISLPGTLLGTEKVITDVGSGSFSLWSGLSLTGLTALSVRPLDTNSMRVQGANASTGSITSLTDANFTDTSHVVISFSFPLQPK